jgi:hypothetical protein
VHRLGARQQPPCIFPPSLSILSYPYLVYAPKSYSSSRILLFHLCPPGLASPRVHSTFGPVPAYDLPSHMRRMTQDVLCCAHCRSLAYESFLLPQTLVDSAFSFLESSFQLLTKLVRCRRVRERESGRERGTKRERGVVISLNSQHSSGGSGG